MTRFHNESAPVMILGGGLAGVSSLYHLKGKKALLFEREQEVGGTARSFKVGGFTFDFTGHLLHLHTPYTKALVTKLLRGNSYSCVRKAWIHSHGTYTRYPFQANTHGLPGPIVDDCVLGFLEATLKKSRRPAPYAKLNFHDWCKAIFGAGISRHFMIPYNEKLFQTSAKKLNVDWCGPFVPTPKLEEVIRGALTPQERGFGYNTTFLYPKKGGIQMLAQALARDLPGIELGTSIQKLAWKKKEALLSDGRRLRYENFINTIPLAEFLGLLEPLPPAIRRARRKLKHAGILCLNIGVERPKISEKSWIYFPEGKYPFYRVGFPMNFTPHAVPQGCSSMYVEVPLSATARLSNAQILKKVVKGLEEAEILRRGDKLPVVQFLPIRCAYVIYDRERAGTLSEIFSFLRRNAIQSIGRYGAWKYSFMEEAILDGKRAAENIG